MSGPVFEAGEFLVQPMTVDVAEAAETGVLRRARVANRDTGHVHYVAEFTAEGGATRLVCSCELPGTGAVRPEGRGGCLHIAAFQEALPAPASAGGEVATTE